MRKPTIEDRLSVLEKEVADLKRAQPAANGKKRHWIEEISGSMKDIPEADFNEFVRLGAEARSGGRR